MIIILKLNVCNFYNNAAVVFDSPLSVELEPITANPYPQLPSKLSYQVNLHEAILSNTREIAK